MLVALLLLACSDAKPASPREPGTPEPTMELTPMHEPAHPEPAPDPTDTVTEASPHHGPDAHVDPDFEDELGVMELVTRNRARMTRERAAPVHVISSRDPLEAGRRICEATVPRRPAETPVLLKPNLSGIDVMGNGIDNGVDLRTTSIEFIRGVVQCLKARGHREITITDAWSDGDTQERWMRVTGLDRLIADEGVVFAPLWDGSEDPMLNAPYPGARLLRDELMVPRVVARHLRDGLYLSLPKLKMHRFTVMSLSIKNAMGVIVLRGAEAPERRAASMHREINPWLQAWRRDQTDDRDRYIDALEKFAQRIVDVLEVELPDAVLIDGVPPVAGDGFALIEPFDEGLAIGSTNPVLADAVAMEWMGYLDNAELEREIRHRTSPVLEEAANRFYGTTDVIRGVRIEGDDFRSRSRVGHYRGFPGFEIGAPPDPPGVPPWIEDAVIARRVAELPNVDGRLDDAAWSRATLNAIDRDWRGQPSSLETSARFVWNAEAICFAFDAAYDELASPETLPEVEFERLYAYDALEVFLDDSPRSNGTYREIELGPRGHFLDIAIDRSARPRGDAAWSSGMRHAASVDEQAKRFAIEACIPAAAFETPLRAGDWRLALYRVVGHGEGQQHLARFPTYTNRPNFHVPERFGWLRLSAD